MTDLESLEQRMGGKFSQSGSFSDLVDHLHSLPAGSRGIVAYRASAGGAGHVVNVVKHDTGHLIFVDGQSGKLALLPTGDEQLYFFMPTHVPERLSISKPFAPTTGNAGAVMSTPVDFRDVVDAVAPLSRQQDLEACVTSLRSFAKSWHGRLRTGRARDDLSVGPRTVLPGVPDDQWQHTSGWEHINTALKPGMTAYVLIGRPRDVGHAVVAHRDNNGVITYADLNRPPGRRVLDEPSSLPAPVDARVLIVAPDGLIIDTAAVTPQTPTAAQALVDAPATDAHGTRIGAIGIEVEGRRHEFVSDTPLGYNQVLVRHESGQVEIKVERSTPYTADNQPTGDKVPIGEVVGAPSKVLDREDRPDRHEVTRLVAEANRRLDGLTEGDEKSLAQMFPAEEGWRIDPGADDIKVRGRILNPRGSRPYTQYTVGVPLARTAQFLRHVANESSSVPKAGALRSRRGIVEDGLTIAQQFADTYRTWAGTTADERDADEITGLLALMYPHVAALILTDIGKAMHRPSRLVKSHLAVASRVDPRALHTALTPQAKKFLAQYADQISLAFQQQFLDSLASHTRNAEIMQALRDLGKIDEDGDLDLLSESIEGISPGDYLHNALYGADQPGMPYADQGDAFGLNGLDSLDDNDGLLADQPLVPLEVRAHARQDLDAMTRTVDQFAALAAGYDDELGPVDPTRVAEQITEAATQLHQVAEELDHIAAWAQGTTAQLASSGEQAKFFQTRLPQSRSAARLQAQELVARVRELNNHVEDNQFKRDALNTVLGLANEHVSETGQSEIVGELNELAAQYMTTLNALDNMAAEAIQDAEHLLNISRSHIEKIDRIVAKNATAVESLQRLDELFQNVTQDSEIIRQWSQEVAGQTNPSHAVLASALHRQTQALEYNFHTGITLSWRDDKTEGLSFTEYLERIPDIMTDLLEQHQESERSLRSATAKHDQSEAALRFNESRDESDAAFEQLSALAASLGIDLDGRVDALRDDQLPDWIDEDESDDDPGFSPVVVSSGSEVVGGDPKSDAETAPDPFYDLADVEHIIVRKPAGADGTPGAVIGVAFPSRHGDDRRVPAAIQALDESSKTHYTQTAGQKRADTGRIIDTPWADQSTLRGRRLFYIAAHADAKTFSITLKGHDSTEPRVVSVGGEQFERLVHQSKALAYSHSGQQSPLLFLSCDAARLQQQGGAIYDFLRSAADKHEHLGEAYGATDIMWGDPLTVGNNGHLVRIPNPLTTDIKPDATFSPINTNEATDGPLDLPRVVEEINAELATIAMDKAAARTLGETASRLRKAQSGVSQDQALSLAGDSGRSTSAIEARIRTMEFDLSRLTDVVKTERGSQRAVSRILQLAGEYAGDHALAPVTAKLQKLAEKHATTLGTAQGMYSETVERTSSAIADLQRHRQAMADIASEAADSVSLTQAIRALIRLLRQNVAQAREYRDLAVLRARSMGPLPSPEDAANTLKNVRYCATQARSAEGHAAKLLEDMAYRARLLGNGDIPEMITELEARLRRLEEEYTDRVATTRKALNSQPTMAESIAQVHQEFQSAADAADDIFRLAASLGINVDAEISAALVGSEAAEETVLGEADDLALPMAPLSHSETGTGDSESDSDVEDRDDSAALMTANDEQLDPIDPQRAAEHISAAATELQQMAQELHEIATNARTATTQLAIPAEEAKSFRTRLRQSESAALRQAIRMRKLAGDDKQNEVRRRALARIINRADEYASDPGKATTVETLDELVTRYKETFDNFIEASFEARDANELLQRELDTHVREIGAIESNTELTMRMAQRLEELLESAPQDADTVRRWAEEAAAQAQSILTDPSPAVAASALHEVRNRAAQARQFQFKALVLVGRMEDLAEPDSVTEPYLQQLQAAMPASRERHQRIEQNLQEAVETHDQDEDVVLAQTLRDNLNATFEEITELAASLDINVGEVLDDLRATDDSDSEPASPPRYQSNDDSDSEPGPPPRYQSDDDSDDESGSSAVLSSGSVMAAGDPEPDTETAPRLFYDLADIEHIIVRRPAGLDGEPGPVIGVGFPSRTNDPQLFSAEMQSIDNSPKTHYTQFADRDLSKSSRIIDTPWDQSTLRGRHFFYVQAHANARTFAITIKGRAGTKPRVVRVSGEHLEHLVHQSKALTRSHSGQQSPLLFLSCSAAQRQHRGGAIYDFLHSAADEHGHLGEAYGATESVSTTLGVGNHGHLIRIPNPRTATGTPAITTIDSEASSPSLNTNETKDVPAPQAIEVPAGLMLGDSRDAVQALTADDYPSRDDRYVVFSHADAYRLLTPEGPIGARQLADRLRADRRWGNRPIVLLASETATDRERGFAAQLARELPGVPIYAPQGTAQVAAGDILVTGPSIDGQATIPRSRVAEGNRFWRFEALPAVPGRPAGQLVVTAMPYLMNADHDLGDVSVGRTVERIQKLARTVRRDLEALRRFTKPWWDTVFPLVDEASRAEELTARARDLATRLGHRAEQIEQSHRNAGKRSRRWIVRWRRIGLFQHPADGRTGQPGVEGSEERLPGSGEVRDLRQRADALRAAVHAVEDAIRAWQDAAVQLREIAGGPDQGRSLPSGAAELESVRAYFTNLRNQFKAAVRQAATAIHQAEVLRDEPPGADPDRLRLARTYAAALDSQDAARRVGSLTDDLEETPPGYYGDFAGIKRALADATARLEAVLAREPLGADAHTRELEHPGAVAPERLPEPERSPAESPTVFAAPDANESAADSPPLNSDPEAVRATLPAYLRNSRTLGITAQIHPAKDLSLAGEVRKLAPGIAETDIRELDRDTREHVNQFLGEGRAYAVTVDGKPAELIVTAVFDWDAVSVLPAEAGDPIVGLTETQATTQHYASHGNAHQIHPKGIVTAIPGLIAGVGALLPTKPASVWSASHQSQFKTTATVELTEHVDVQVPVTFRATLRGADGAPISTTGTGTATARGTVALRVPTGLVEPPPLPPLSEDTQLLDTAPPKRFAVESVDVPPLFDQVEKMLADQGLGDTIRVGAPGRQVLREFLSVGKVTENLGKMVVHDPSEEDRGWVSPPPLLRSRTGWRRPFPGRDQQIQLRLVARQVQVVQPVDEAAYADIDAFTNEHSDSASADHPTTVWGIGGGGTDIPPLSILVGPRIAQSRTGDTTQEIKEETNTRQTLTARGPVVRYETVYELQVRLTGQRPRTLTGTVRTLQWTTQDRIRDTALDPERAGTRRAGRRGHERTHYAPAHIENGEAFGGAHIESIGGGERLYQAILTALRSVPGYRRFTLESDAFLRSFGDPDLAKGLTDSVDAILKRNSATRTNLSSRQLRYVLDRIVGPGLEIPLIKRDTWFTYTTVVTIRGRLDELSDGELSERGPLHAEHKRKTRTTTTVRRNRTHSTELAVEGRFLGRLGRAFGIHVGGPRGVYGRSRSHEIELSQSYAADAEHGPALDDDGNLSSHVTREFTATVQASVSLRSSSRTTANARHLIPGWPGRGLPKEIGHVYYRPKAFPLSVQMLIPEHRLTPRPPAPSPRPAPVGRRWLTETGPVSEVKGGFPLGLDGARIETFRGVEHLQEAVKETLVEASGDDIYAFPDGRNSTVIADEISPEKLTGGPDVFSRPLILSNLGHDRRLALAKADARVSLRPTNPRELPHGEFERVKTALSGGSAVRGKSGRSAELAFSLTSVPVITGAGVREGSVTAHPAGVIVGSLTPWQRVWGRVREISVSGRTKTRLGTRPTGRILVQVDVEAEVVAEAVRRTHLDPLGVTREARPRTAGQRFTMPGAVLMWVTSAQLAALRQHDEQAEPAHEPGTEIPAPIPPGRPASLGLGGALTPLDLGDVVATLRKEIAREIGRTQGQEKGDEFARALLPESPLDKPHDNVRLIRTFLHRAEQHLAGALNGGRSLPIRLEGRFRGHTYRVTLNAEFLRQPRFAGIEHVDELSVSDSTAIRSSDTHTRGRTLATFGLAGRPQGIWTENTPAGEPPQTSGHGPATGFVGGGYAGTAQIGDRSIKDTRHTELLFEQRLATGGPIAKYDGDLRLTVTVTGRDLPETGVTVTENRTVAVHTIPGDTRPRAVGDRPLGHAEPSAVLPRGELTDSARKWWLTAEGKHETLPERGRFAVEHVLLDVDDLHAVARQTLIDSGARVDHSTEAALRDGITETKIKAALVGGMTEGHFVVPLGQADRELVIDARLRPAPRFAHADARVQIEGEQGHKSGRTLERTNGHVFSLQLHGPVGGGGVNHPSGANEVGERHPFGQVHASTFVEQPLYASDPERIRKAEVDLPGGEIVELPETARSDDPVTRSVAYEVEFRIIARPLGTTAKPHAGREVRIPDAVTVRMPDAEAEARTGMVLPPALRETARELARRSEEWTAAVNRRDALLARENPDIDTLRAAQRAVSDAETAWWTAHHANEAQLEAARSADAVRAEGTELSLDDVRTVPLRNARGETIGVGFPSQDGDDDVMSRFAAATHDDPGTYRRFKTDTDGTYTDEPVPWRARPVFVDAHGDAHSMTVRLKNGETVRLTGTDFARLAAQAHVMQPANPGPAAPVVLLSCNTAGINKRGGAAYDFHHTLQTIRHPDQQTYAATNQLLTNPNAQGKARIGVSGDGRIIGFGTPGQNATTPQPPQTPADTPQTKPAEHPTEDHWTARPSRLPPVDNTVGVQDLEVECLWQGDEVVGLNFPLGGQDPGFIRDLRHAVRQRDYLAPSPRSGRMKVVAAPWEHFLRTPLVLNARTAESNYAIVRHRTRGHIRVDGATLARLAHEAGLLNSRGADAPIVLLADESGRQRAAGGLANDFAEAAYRRYNVPAPVFAPDAKTAFDRRTNIGLPDGGRFAEFKPLAEDIEIEVIDSDSDEPPQQPTGTPSQPSGEPAASAGTVADRNGDPLGFSLVASPRIRAELTDFAQGVLPSDTGSVIQEADLELQTAPWAPTAARPAGKPVFVFVERAPDGTGFRVPAENGATTTVAPRDLARHLQRQPGFQELDDSPFNRPLVLVVLGDTAGLTPAEAQDLLDGQIAVGGYRPIHYPTGESAQIRFRKRGGITRFAVRNGSFTQARRVQLSDITVEELPGDRGLALPLPGDANDVTKGSNKPGEPRGTSSYCIAVAGDGQRVWVHARNGRKLELTGTDLAGIVSTHSRFAELLADGTTKILLGSPQAGAQDEPGRVGHDFATRLPIDLTQRTVRATTGDVLWASSGKIGMLRGEPPARVGTAENPAPSTAATSTPTPPTTGAPVAPSAPARPAPPPASGTDFDDSVDDDTAPNDPATLSLADLRKPVWFDDGPGGIAFPLNEHEEKEEEVRASDRSSWFGRVLQTNPGADRLIDTKAPWVTEPFAVYARSAGSTHVKLALRDGRVVEVDGRTLARLVAEAYRARRGPFRPGTDIVLWPSMAGKTVQPGHIAYDMLRHLTDQEHFTGVVWATNGPVHSKRNHIFLSADSSFRRFRVINNGQLKAIAASPVGPGEDEEVHHVNNDGPVVSDTLSDLDEDELSDVEDEPAAVSSHVPFDDAFNGRFATSSRPPQTQRGRHGPRIRPVVDARGRVFGVVIAASPAYLNDIVKFADNHGEGALDVVRVHRIDLNGKVTSTFEENPWGGPRPRPGGRPLMIFLERAPGGDNFLVASHHGGTITVSPRDLPRYLDTDPDFRKIDDSAFNRPLVLLTPDPMRKNTGHADWIRRAAEQFLQGQLAVGGYRAVYFARSGMLYLNGFQQLNAAGIGFDLVREPELDDLVVVELSGNRGIAFPLEGDPEDVTAPVIAANGNRRTGADLLVVVAGNGTEVWVQTRNGRKLALDGTTFGKIAANHPLVRQALDGPPSTGLLLASPKAGEHNDTGHTGYDFALGTGANTTQRTVKATRGNTVTDTTNTVRMAEIPSGNVRSLVIKSTTAYPGAVGVIFPTPTPTPTPTPAHNPATQTNVKEWADNTDKNTITKYGKGVRGQVLSPRPPWQQSPTMPVVVLLGSDDGRTFTMRGEQPTHPVKLPVNELARVLAASPAFKEVADAYSDKPIIVLLPATFSTARAARATESLSSGLKRRGYFRTVHAVAGSALLRTGQITVPTWSMTVEPGPLLPKHVDIRPLFYRDGSLAGVSFPRDLNDASGRSQYVYNTDVGGPTMYQSLPDPTGDDTATKHDLREPNEQWDALVFAHGNPGRVAVRMRRGGDKIHIDGDELAKLMHAAGCLKAFSPAKYRGFLSMSCSIGKITWPHGPMSAFARRLHALGDHRPVRAASGDVELRWNGTTRVTGMGVFTAFPANGEILPEDPSLGSVADEPDWPRPGTAAPPTPSPGSSRSHPAPQQPAAPTQPAPLPQQRGVPAPQPGPQPAPLIEVMSVRHVVVRRLNIPFGMGFPTRGMSKADLDGFLTEVDLSEHQRYSRYDRDGLPLRVEDTPWGGKDGARPKRVFWIDVRADGTTFRLDEVFPRRKVFLDGTGFADLVLASKALHSSRSGLGSVIVLLGSRTSAQHGPGGAGYDFLVRLRQFGFTGEVYGMTGGFHPTFSSKASDDKLIGVDEGRITLVDAES
ncbi:hypothetical protein LDL48_32095 [Wangella sp. NEAU-J3]|nr:hypothetical protein [Jidongwangia harbinensis]